MGADETDNDYDECNDSIPEEMFRCNICGQSADFVVQLELIKERSNYNVMNSVSKMPFYLCKNHEYLYNKMQNNVELKDYFNETIKENQ